MGINIPEKIRNIYIENMKQSKCDGKSVEAQLDSAKNRKCGESTTRKNRLT